MAFEYLSKEQVLKIHEASLEILEKVGVGNKSKRMRDLLLDNGCKEKGNRILFPRDVVEKGLKTVPKSFKLHGRRDNYVLDIGEKKSYCQTVVGSPSVMDLESNRRRDCMVQDLADMTRLADALDYIHLIAPLFPRDVPQEVILTIETAVLLKNTSKPLSICVESSVELKYIIELLAAVAGGKAELKQKPMATLPISTISPLEFGLHPAEALIDIVEAGLPLGIEPAPQAGATAPITLAGLVAQHNAELLAGAVAAQFVRPGAPLTLSSRACFMDLRSGQGLWGMPEFGLGAAAMNQMGNFYQIPVAPGAYSGESKTADAQSTMEHLYNAMAPALVGSDILGSAGSVDSVQAACFKMLVLDNEISSAIQKAIQPPVVDEDTLALDVIAEIEKEVDFLGHKHTRKHLRAGALWTPTLMTRQTYEQWEEHGQGLDEKAKERAKELLATHTVLPLAEGLLKEFDTIIAAAKKDLLPSDAE